jgi:hypothetical protein
MRRYYAENSETIRAARNARHAKNPDVQRSRSKERYEKQRAAVSAVKARPCADCGVQYPSHVMDFDHREPAKKKFQISHNYMRPMKSIMAEIAKCDVVCANCHRIRTHERRSA